MSAAGRALVTGGAGFIGSQLVDALVARGDEVTVLDDLSTGRRENLAPALGRGATLVEGSVIDSGALVGVVEERRVDRLFHLAGQIDVRRSIDDPAFDAAVNVLGTINALEAARAHQPCALVFVSSVAAIYRAGVDYPMPLAEAGGTAPDSPYGQSKLAGEGYVDLLARLHGVPAATVRLANVYGPRQSSEGEAGVVAIFCSELLRDGTPTVFGDGTQTRDFVYVDDVVAAMLAADAAVAGGAETPLGPFNVGTGVETTVLELVERLAAIADRPGLEPKAAPPRKGEIDRVALDSSLAQRELGWRPAVDLETGLERTFAALRDGAAVAGSKD